MTPEDGGVSVLRNVGMQQPCHAAQQNLKTSNSVIIRFEGDTDTKFDGVPVEVHCTAVGYSDRVRKDTP